MEVSHDPAGHLGAFRFRAALDALRPAAGAAPDDAWCERTRLELLLLAELEGPAAARERAAARVRESARASAAVRARVLADHAIEERFADPRVAREAVEAGAALAGPDPLAAHHVRLARAHLCLAADDMVGARTALHPADGAVPAPLLFDTCVARAAWYGTGTPRSRETRERAHAAARNPLDRARAVTMLAADLLAVEGAAQALALLEPEIAGFRLADAPVRVLGLLHSLAGAASLVVGRGEDALRYLLLARAAAPTHPLPAFNLALLYATSRAPDRALEVLTTLGGVPLPRLLVAGVAAVRAACTAATGDAAAFDTHWRAYLEAGAPTGAQVDHLVDFVAACAERHPGAAWREHAVDVRRHGIGARAPALRLRHERGLRRLASRGAAARIGPYRLVGRLGSGAYGEVRTAVTATGAPVAVKIVRIGDERSAAKVDNELRAVAALDHPRVIRLLHHGVVGPDAAAMDPTLRTGTAWLAMPLVEGGTLASRLGTCGWEEAREHLLALLDGLAHAHARGVLHLDVKPANLLVAADGLRIADFGVALVGERRATATPAGTPAYMAPEAFLPGAAVPATDLYAVGCVAVALVSGAPPFDGTSSEELRDAHRTRAPSVVPAFAVPAGFRPWALRLLAKDPGDRYLSAADAARALLAIATRPATPLGTPTAEDELAPLPPPAVPADWRRLDAGPGPQDPGDAGLGLFGLRVPPFVGRVRERSLLWDLLREVHRDCRVRTVGVDGAAAHPPGLGATGLAAWLAERALELGSAAVRVVEPAPSDAPCVAFRRGADGPTDPDDVASWLAEGADRPSIVRIDRPDAMALAVVERLAGRRRPLLVVVSGAPAGVALDARVVLQPLPPVETAALVSGLLPFDPALERRLVGTVGGHPRFAVQLVTHLVETSMLVPSPAGYRLRADLDPLPGSLDALSALRWEVLAAALEAPERWTVRAVARTRVVDQAAFAGTCDEHGCVAADLRARLLAGRFVVSHPVGFAFDDEGLRRRIAGG